MVAGGVGMGDGFGAPIVTSHARSTSVYVWCGLCGFFAIGAAPTLMRFLDFACLQTVTHS